MFRYSYVVYQSYKTIIFHYVSILAPRIPFSTLPVCSLYSHTLSLDKNHSFYRHASIQFNSVSFPKYN